MKCLRQAFYTVSSLSISGTSELLLGVEFCYDMQHARRSSVHKNTETHTPDTWRRVTGSFYFGLIFLCSYLKLQGFACYLKPDSWVLPALPLSLYFFKQITLGSCNLRGFPQLTFSLSFHFFINAIQKCKNF